MSLYFPAAPWPSLLKITSALGTVALIAVGVTAYRVIPAQSGLANTLGLAITLIPTAIFMGSVLFVVIGYSVDEHNLYIRRLVSRTRISLDGVSQIWLGPRVCEGAFRLFGNGGLYSYTGLYRSSTIGRFRLFGTDLSRSVVLVLPQGAVIVTPTAPHTFVEYLKRHFPTANSGHNESVS